MNSAVESFKRYEDAFCITGFTKDDPETHRFMGYCHSSEEFTQINSINNELFFHNKK